MSQGELERMTRRYTSEIMDFIGPEKDVPAPDMNTNEQTMAWIMDTYSMHMRHTVTSVVTGKPLNMGGSRGRARPPAAACMVVCDESLRYLQPADRWLPGRHPGLRQRGLECRAAADGARLQDRRHRRERRRPVQCERHRHSPLVEYKYRNGTMLGFRGAEAMPSEELLVSDCDMLIPAATENVITSRNAAKIKARIIVEGANGPTTAVADEILADKRIFIVPDILANAGGVTRATSSGCRTGRATSGRKQSSTSSWRDPARQLRRRGPLRRGPQREQPHRGVHAGHRSRGIHHQAARDLRVATDVSWIGMGRFGGPFCLWG